MKTKKHCSNCEFDELCGWKHRDERGYCDKWKSDGEDEEDEDHSMYLD